MTSGDLFSKLKKTINIVLLAFNWFQDNRYHRSFHLKDDKTGEALTDLLEIHILEIEKIKGLGRRPKDALEAWLVYFSNLEGKEMEEIAMENPAIRKALTVEEMFWQSEKERRIYELQEKALHERLSALAEARAEARAEGEAGAKQDAICKFLEKRFRADTFGLQQKVHQTSKLEVLDRILEELFSASTLEEAKGIINGQVH